MNKKVLLLSVGSVALLYGEEAAVQTVSEAFYAWGALFLLALVGIVVLFVTSVQMKKIRKLHKDVLQKQQEMERQQTTLMTNMRENIHDMTKKAIENRNSVMEYPEDQSLESVLAEVVHAENTLLGMTNDLIDFLQIKSGKVEIVNEKFNLNNVLNEVSGLIGSSYHNNNVELIFDVNKSIPRFLIGDSPHLVKVLKNLLENSMMMTSDGEVVLEITRFSAFGEKLELKFRIIDTGTVFNPEVLEQSFEPHYNDETGDYKGLKLFIAKELIQLMGGELTIQSATEKGNILAVVLPLDSISSESRKKYHFQKDIKFDNRRNYHFLNNVNFENRRKYRLPRKVLTTKNVMIVDSNQNSALAVKKMFTYFKHKVKIIARDEFVKTMPDFSEYDIAVIDEGLFDNRVIDNLKKIRREKELKVIGLRSLFYFSENKLTDEIVDGRLQKPLNQERVYDLIIDLYRSNKTAGIPEEISTQQKKENSEAQTARVYKMAIEETKNVTRQSFSDFRGSRILIVDDNIINQKVLTSILDQSEMEITLANNGEEAVDLVTAGLKQFDLVLMDIYMPVMDGYTAVQMIRDTGRFNSLPIIAFTAFVLDSEVEKVFSSGMNALLYKPLNLGKLYSVFSLFAGTDSAKRKISGAAEKEIDGIDIHDGIRLAGGNEVLYLEVLKDFLEAYGESGELFEKLIKEKRFEQAKMLALDMKGLTGTIGAKDMHREIDEIYKLFIYNSQFELLQHVDTYKNELSKLKHAINQYIENESNHSGIVEVA